MDMISSRGVIINPHIDTPQPPPTLNALVLVHLIGGGLGVTSGIDLTSGTQMFGEMGEHTGSQHLTPRSLIVGSKRTQNRRCVTV